MSDIARAIAAWYTSRWAADDRGASLVEYALLLSLIAFVCISAIGYFGASTAARNQDSADRIVVAN